MNLTKELLAGLVQTIIDKQKKTPEVLWCVTSFRTNVFCLLKNLGLTRPDGVYDAAVVDQQLIADVLCDYASILTTFPAEIKYNDDNVETPRANALARSFEVMNGLVSDEKEWESAQELSRLVATNADSEHQKLDYAVLMGIVLRILMLLHIDTAEICNHCIETLTKKTEA